MPYLILDPCDDYAANMKRFLDRLGLEAVALFSTPGHQHVWNNRWREQLGENVVGEYLVDRGNVTGLARTLEGEFGGGFFGLVAWDERHILLAAEIGEALDLDWNPREVIERCRDKYMMKAWLRQHSAARINASRTVEDAQEAITFQREVGAWPIVVKPTGGAGSMAVYFAHSDGELLHGCQRVLESGLGEVLLEEYVGGDEFAVNGVVDHAGDLLVTDIWYYDKRDSHGQRNLYYETIKLGSREEPFAAIVEYAAQVVKDLGLRRSPIHMEVKVDDDGPCLIEIGARFAGGNQPMLGSRLQHHSVFELAACHYLDDLRVSAQDVDYEYYDSLSARILSGIQTVELERIEAVLGVDEVRELPSFAGIGILRKPGTRLPASRDINSKSYEVYLLHPDPQQVAADAIAARRLIRYV